MHEKYKVLNETELMISTEIFKVIKKQPMAGLYYSMILHSPKRLMPEYIIEEKDTYKSYSYGYYYVFSINSLIDDIYMSAGKPKNLSIYNIKNILQSLQDGDIFMFYTYSFDKGFKIADLKSINNNQIIYAEHLLKGKLNYVDNKKQVFFKIYYDDIQRILHYRLKKPTLKIQNYINVYMILCSYMSQHPIAYPSIEQIVEKIGDKKQSSISKYIVVLKELNIFYVVSGGFYKKGQDRKHFNNIYILTRISNYKDEVDLHLLRVKNGMINSGWTQIGADKENRKPKKVAQDVIWGASEGSDNVNNYDNNDYDFDF